MRQNTERVTVAATLLVCATLSVACRPGPTEHAPPPNILYIVADDIGMVDLGVYNPDAPSPTPNIDALARAGMRFTDAHSPATLCVPSRYGILTGNYVWRGRTPGGTWSAYEPSQILPAQQTIAEMLRDAGYHTGFFGKWHLGGSYYRKGSDEFTTEQLEIDFGRRFREGPLDVGFDYSFLLPSGIQGRPRAFFRNDEFVGDPQALVPSMTERPPRASDGRGRGSPGAVAPDWDPATVGPRLLEEALAFIDRHHTRNLADRTTAPLFLYYSATEVHAPHAPAVDMGGVQVRGRTGRGPRADLVWQLDVVVGSLLDALARRDLLNDTLIVFTSDNGSVLPGELRVTGALSGSKGTAEEGGHRVPLIVRWGDGTPRGSRVAPDSRSTQLIGIQDFVATAAEVVGLEMPPDQAVDSISFLDTLTGKRPDGDPLRDNLLVWAQNRLNPEREPERKIVLRQGDWKLVVDGEHQPVALYDLGRNIVEDASTNLVDSPEHRGRVDAMAREFERLYDSARSVPARPAPTGGPTE